MNAIKNAMVVVKPCGYPDQREGPFTEEAAKVFARSKIKGWKNHPGGAPVEIEILEPAVALVYGGDIEELSHFAEANRAAVLKHLSSEQKDALILNAAKLIEQQRDGIEARDEQIEQLQADLKDVEADRGMR